MGSNFEQWMEILESTEPEQAYKKEDRKTTKNDYGKTILEGLLCATHIDGRRQEGLAEDLGDHRLREGGHY